jgi:hypothetical protein
MSTTNAQLQGFGRSEKVQIDARRWFALRRQLVRMVLGWRHMGRESERILAACRHAESCPATADSSRPCLAECPDREVWLSALVISHNAAEFTTIVRGLPMRLDGDYSPPQRETWDAIVTELEALRAGRDLLAEIEAATRGYALVDDEAAAEQAEQPTTRLVPPGQEIGAATQTEGDADGSEGQAGDAGTGEVHADG